MIPFRLTRWWALLLLVVLSLWAVYLDGVSELVAVVDTREFFNDHVAPYVDIVTLMIAMVVWAIQTQVLWKQSLPNRMSIVFKLGDDELLVCNFAHLPDASAIRELSQTIGRQMIDPQGRQRGLMIPFCSPNITLTDEGVVALSIDGERQYVMHHRVEFQLMARPSGLAEEARVEWNPPFASEDLVNIAPDKTRTPRRHADPQDAPDGLP